jgi:perosamine synthetase
MPISWNEPKIGKTEYKLVKEVLDTAYLGEGPMTKKLEQKLAKIVGTKHIIMTTSATAALYLAIEADKRIRRYSEGEVIIPNITMVATKNAVELANLSICISEVSPDRFMLDDIDARRDTKIIIPVNLLGRSCTRGNGELDSGQITFICDNAGCLGSKVPNGKVGCYSMQSNKLLTSGGQGGFCATDDDEYAKVIRQIKDFGRVNKDQNDTTGFNFKFNDVQSAIALGQIEQLEQRKKLHLKQFKKYFDELNKLGNFVEYLPGELPLWVEFITPKRDELFDYLQSKGISARKPWNCFIQTSEYKNSLKYQDEVIWLPNGASLNDNQQKEVIKEIKSFYGI